MGRASGGGRAADRAVLVVKDSAEVYAVRGGRVELVARSEDLVTDRGLSMIAGLIGGIHAKAFRYVAVGSGTTPPTSSDTSLEREVARVLGTVSQETKHVANDTVAVRAEFTFPSGATISEAGLFDSPSGGNMLNRVIFRPFVAQPGETVWVVLKVTIRRRQ